MKYTDKVIDLMADYPGRPFVMRQIVHYANPRAGRQERIAIKKALQRVMQALVDAGTVTVTPRKALGGQARYYSKASYA